MKNQHKGRANKKTRNPEPEKSGPCPGTGNCGFTLLEIIAVLVIAAIAAAVIINSVSRSKADLTGRSEALRAHIRYAQSMAMSTDDRNWGIRFHTNPNHYWLFYCNSGDTCNWGENQTHIPGTETDQTKVDLGEYDININNINHGDNRVTLAFDNFGTPYWGGHNEVLENLLETQFIITLEDDSSNDTETISVTPTTGFVQ
ncbi:MAG: prepilin-type N-terminal cleavage/methylation domain-containing protein [Desulfobacterales bacterium]